MQRDRMFLGFWLLALGACTARAPDVSTETSLPASEPSAPAVEAISASTPAWPMATRCGDLVKRLAQLDETVLGELPPAGAPIAVAATGDSSTLLSQRINLPQAEPKETTARCTIVLGEVLALPAAADRVLDRRVVHSAYPTGIKRRRNPDHQKLEKELTAARRGSGDDIDVAATGDPLMDLIGTVASSMIGGIDAVWQKRQIRAIENELAATPAFIEDQIRTPYRFQVTDIAAERRIALPVALHDAVTEEAWTTSLTLSERRRFAVAEDRHPGDTTPVQAAGATIVTAAELASWRAAGPPLEMRELLIHLAAAQRDGPAQPATLAATIAGLRTSDPAASTRLALNDTAARPAETPARSAGLPRARDGRASIGRAATAAALHPPEPAAGPGQAAGASAAARMASWELLEVGAPPMPGFYVSSEHILTPAAALGRSSLVAIRYPDGMRSHGMTEIVDDELGLAIVFVPRRGEAAPIRGIRSDAPAAAGPNGIPWTRDAEVVGLFVAGDERSRWIDGAALEHLVNRLDSL